MAASTEHIHVNGVLWWIDREHDRGQLTRPQAYQEAIDVRSRWFKGDVDAMRAWEAAHDFDPHNEVPWRSWAGDHYDPLTAIDKSLKKYAPPKVQSLRLPDKKPEPYYTGQLGRAEGAVEYAQQLGYKANWRKLGDGERHHGRKYVVEVIG